MQSVIPAVLSGWLQPNKRGQLIQEQEGSNSRDVRLAVDEATDRVGVGLAPTKRKGPDDNPGRGLNGGR
jgi:hypothetical protein